MKTLSKQNIEALAQEIITFLEEEQLQSDVSIYFNDKVIRNRSHHDADWNFTYAWETTDGVSPHDYFEYAAYDHILSMSFEGALYNVLNYSFGRREEEFNAIFEKYGLYTELGNAWNLSAYPVRDDMEIEYTYYNRPKQTVYLYRDMDNLPSELAEVMFDWWRLSKAAGESGSCVLGAGFEFEWNDNKYFMPAQSPYQGSISWETPKDQIKKMLDDIGATNIYYNWGRMD